MTGMFFYHYPVSKLRQALLVAAFAIVFSVPTTVNGSAASKIAVLVNKEPITSNQIKRRAAFLKLRRVKGNRSQMAKDELVEEALKLQEARRLGVSIPQKQIDDAYANFAKRNKMPLKALNQIMASSGVTKRGFKDYLRAQMVWQSVVGRRYHVQNRPKSAKSGIQSWLSDGNNRATEYTIKQVVFVVPRDKLESGSKARMSEANNFRSRFTGCENARTMAAQLRDVSVVDRGRLQEHELPKFWAKELRTTRPGEITRPVKTAKGLELMAVCKTRKVLSTISVESTNEFGLGDFSKEAEALSKKYLAELKKVAVIKNR